MPVTKSNRNPGSPDQPTRRAERLAARFFDLWQANLRLQTRAAALAALAAAKADDDPA